MKLTKEQATDLAYGKPVEIAGGYAGGYTLRFRTTPDDHTNLNDYDCYGKVTPRHQYDDPRPDGFDGMAEVLHTRSTAWWWQPSPDLRKGWGSYAHKRELRQMVIDILEYGFMCYWVEVCDGTDAYGNPVVVDYVVEGGYEPFMKEDDVAGVIMDMVADFDETVLAEIGLV